MATFRKGDRVQNPYGPTGTVVKVFPAERIALVRWDDDNRPVRLDPSVKEWHVSYSDIEKMAKY